MFNSFDNKNNINPLISPALFNFDGFLRTGVGDPLQVQLAVKFTFYVWAGRFQNRCDELTP